MLSQKGNKGSSSLTTSEPMLHVSYSKPQDARDGDMKGV